MTRPDLCRTWPPPGPDVQEKADCREPWLVQPGSSWESQEMFTFKIIKCSLMSRRGQLRGERCRSTTTCSPIVTKRRETTSEISSSLDLRLSSDPTPDFLSFWREVCFGKIVEINQKEKTEGSFIKRKNSPNRLHQILQTNLNPTRTSFSHFFAAIFLPLLRLCIGNIILQKTDVATI